MDPRDTVVVTGTGRVATAPDSINVNLQLEGHGTTVTEAIAALTTAVADCGAALPDHRLRTHGLGLRPRHDHQGRQVGHTAYQSLQVRTDQPAEVGNLVAQLANAAGQGLSVTGLRPEVTDPTEAALAAREEAMTQARERAEHYAQLAGRALGPVLWVREGHGASPRPMAAAMQARAMADGPAVDAADEEVVAVIEVGWSLVD